MQEKQRLRAPMLLLFFLSGIAGLVYQIVWTRLLVLVFGNTLLATSTVVSAYMAGLASGSLVVGRFVDQRPRPLVRLYALLEAGIGAFALLFPLLLSAATPLYAALYRSLQGNLALLNLARFAVCFVLILVPTFLMGGTLPVLLKRFGRAGRGLGYEAGLFYGLNTAGAVIGCLATGYVLLGALGMRRTTWIAVALNLGVAVAAWLLAAAGRDTEETATAEPAAGEGPTSSTHGPLAVRAVLAGTGLSGFCALAYELLWTRMLNLFLNNNVYSFTAVLATFLAGIALGSLVYSSLLSRSRRPVVLFAGLQLGIALWAWATPFLFGLLQGALFSRQSDALTLAKTAVVMIPPTALMGIALPLAVGICRRGPRREGTTVGTVYAVNTVGSILGSFAAGFVLVPHVGLHRGLVIVVGLNLLAAFLAAIAVARPRSRPAWAMGFAGLAAAAFLGAPRTLFRELYERAQPSAGILLYEEGRVANVVVYDFHKSGYKDLYLNAIEEASSRLWHVQLFKMLGILPVMVHEQPGQALMIAFGAGMSAGATAPHVSSLDVVDLNPDVAGVAKVFTHENLDVLEAKNLRRVVNDGRNALLLDPGRYSVVISDATNPKTFDSWTLYTREFYRLVKSRLEPGGVFCQWFVVPLPGDAVKVLLATFREVFPHASLWCVYGSSQCLMLATPGRLAIDHEALTRRMAPVWRPSGLAEFGIADADKLLSYLLLGEDELAAALRGVTRVNTDDRPYAQFLVGREVEGVRAFLDLLEHQASLEPYLTGAGPASLERLEAYRSLSRRLHLAFLLNNPGEVEEARAVAARAGLGDDENVRSGLMYDSKREEYFRERLARGEQDANAHNSLGYVHWREGRREDARRELARAVELAPSFANARANLARVHRDAGRYDEAEREWIELRRRNPARDVLPMVRRELDLLHLLRKLRYEPRSAPLLLAVADAHARAGSMVEAAEATRAAAAASPRDPAILLKLASLYENLEFVEDALGAYRALEALGPGDPRVTAKVAEFELLARDRSARQRWLNSNEIVLGKKGEDDGGHPAACRRAMRLWGAYPFEGSIDRRDLARAADLFERALEASPEHMHAYGDAALVREALGQHARAAELWARGLEAAPGNRGAENNRRRLALLASLDAGGQGEAERAQSLAEVGRLDLAAGEAERAIESLSRADPELTGAWRDLAQAYVEAGRYPEAIATLERWLAAHAAAAEAPSVRESLVPLKRLVAGAATPR